MYILQGHPGPLKTLRWIFESKIENNSGKLLKKLRRFHLRSSFL